VNGVQCVQKRVQRKRRHVRVRQGGQLGVAVRQVGACAGRARRARRYDCGCRCGCHRYRPPARRPRACLLQARAYAKNTI
jgi:hypothetical protein